MSATVLVSVVVIHHEQPRELARTLAGLARQQLEDTAVEVIVVDDGSSRLPEVPSGVALLSQARDGARRSAARNRGATAARGDVLCFLDADTTPEPGYVQAIVRAPLTEGRTVAVGRRRHADLARVPVNVPVEIAGPARVLPGPQWLARGYRETDDLRRADRRSFRFVISSVLAVRRSFFGEVGGFDESFRAYGGEDWEWAHRAWLAGARLLHVPEAVAWHDGPDWSDRSGDEDATLRRRLEKNAEARRLSELISVPGHRARGLLGGRGETMIELAPELGIDATFITTDCLLAALPQARISGGSELEALAARDPRIRVGDGSAGDGRAVSDPPAALTLTVHAGIRCDTRELAALCARILDEDLVGVSLADEGGELIRILSSRHGGRVERIHPAWLTRLPDPPDVEAYLGGWER